jgi:endonuclease YncB( thermonuclease family)
MENKEIKKIDVYHTDDLVNNSFENIKKYTYDGLITKAKVIDVYDGDTITIVFYFNDNPIKDSFRMYGYDSPEIKPRKNILVRDLHVKAGKLVRDYLKQLILGKVVWVKFCKEEKYGRLMGNIFMIGEKSKDCFEGTEQCINDIMIEKKCGKTYDGGHKSDFTEEELKEIIKKIEILNN